MVRIDDVVEAFIEGKSRLLENNEKWYIHDVYLVTSIRDTDFNKTTTIAQYILDDKLERVGVIINNTYYNKVITKYQNKLIKAFPDAKLVGGLPENVSDLREYI